ncbi:MAG TPA: hypothetical protein VF165_02965 [Nocardioidaceae bacterium]
MSTPRTHPLNAGYLVIGLIFLGLAASWALRQAGVIDFAEVRWLLPLTLVAAGLVGIVAMTVKGLSRREADTLEDDPYRHDTYEGEER